jgi:hypothetical protein
MDNQIVTHITQNGKYKIQYEQAATKGIIGFKVEANNDDLLQCRLDASELLGAAIEKARIFCTTPEVK